jgi:predicted transcriptional regulator/transcriptional regulator with XRE-family HTH domain
MAYDPLVFGQRLRHLRRERNLTLAELGELVGKPAPYLSMVENGKREPKASVIGALASSLGVGPAELLDPEPPTRRAALEVRLERIQTDPSYERLGLPHLKPTAGTPDAALEHLVGLYDAWREAEAGSSDQLEQIRRAVVDLRDEARASGNHRPDVEAIAAEALAAIGHDGPGSLSQREVTDLAAHFGFAIKSVSDFPTTARAVLDRREGVLYIPQRDALRTRAARFVIFQSLGHVALDHDVPSDYPEFLAQRLAANYFAGAVLMPERPVATFMADAKERRDLSVEDLKERYYVSYETAAHRFTNLATAHLDIPVHFLRTNDQGTIRRSYENDGIPLPRDRNGIVDGNRVCREWPARAAFRSDDTYDIYYQYTDTPNGTFWSSAHVEVDRSPAHVITLGTDFDHARWFRGRGTDHHAVSRCPAGPCCRQPTDVRSGGWDTAIWPMAMSLSHRVAALPAETFPGVDLGEIAELVD